VLEFLGRGLLACLLLLLLIALDVATLRRQRIREAEAIRQITLTDAVHFRLGRLLAPVVRYRRGVWVITVAVASEPGAIVAPLLATVADIFAHTRYEVHLRAPDRSRRTEAR
jgi:hypothetical protein